MRLLLQFSSLAVALAASSAVAALPCVVFDNQFNLYAFGGSKDWSLGQQDSWSDVKANALEAAGRPPFNTDNARCFLAQFFNSLYVLGADSQNPSDVHIFDFGAKSWSTQKTSAAMDPTATILDRDTNVMFSLTNGQLSQLDLGSQTRAAGGAANWDTVGPPNFDTTSYTKPVLALAQNHIHFLGVPGLSAGQASIFVIHFAFFQPARQDYPVYEGASGNTFPNSPGQVVSIFQGEDHVQEQFAFFPDDNSNTYFVDVQRNRTLPLAPPSDRTPKSSFTASQTAVVHLSQSGSIYYLPVNPDAFNPDSPNPSLMSGASWTKLGFSDLVPVSGTTSGSLATPNNTTKPGGTTTTTPGGNSGTSKPNKPDSAGSMVQSSVMIGFATAILATFLAATTSVF